MNPLSQTLYRSRSYLPAGTNLLRTIPGMGSILTLAGFFAIAMYIAPGTVNAIFPGTWQKYSWFIGVAVALGLLLASLKLVWQIVSLAFWCTAAFAIFTLLMPNAKSYSPLKDVSHSASSSKQVTSHEEIKQTPVAVIKQRKLPPALPDSAYFPAQPSAGAGFGVGSLINQLPAPLRGLVSKFTGGY